MNTLYHEWLARQHQDQITRDAKRRDGWCLHESAFEGRHRSGPFAWLRRLTGTQSVGEGHPVVAERAEAPKAGSKRAG